MPDQGQLTLDRLPHSSPLASPLYPAPPWPLADARILKVAFETSPEAVLTWLPPKLTRSSPPYAVITVCSYADSPVGPFNVATQNAGCRAGFFVRAFALQSIVDNPVAYAALREVWGLPCRLGQVAIERTDESVVAEISADDDLLARVSLTDAQLIDSSSARIDPVLAVRAIPSIADDKKHDVLQLVQIDPDYEISECRRGSGGVEYPVHSDTNPWDQVPMLSMISAIDVRASTEMPLARYVMPY